MVCATAAQAGFGAGERGIADAAAHARGRAGEEDRALTARQHQPRRLAPGEEAGVAGQLPDLAEHALGRVQQRKIDIGADVEDADFERRVRVGGAQKSGNVLLLARIKPARHDLPPAASISSTSGASLSALRRPAKMVKPSAANCFGDGGADEIAGSDDRRGGIALSQLRPPRAPARSATPRCGILRHLSR